MTYYSPTPIALDDASHRVPALLGNPHASRSARYEHIPTIRVLEALNKEGFNIHGITTAKVRDGSRAGFQKHLIRLRKQHDVTVQEAPEVILINSHDGSCAYQLRVGMFRFACANGLIAGETWKSVNVAHKGANTVGNVIDATYEVVGEFDRLQDSVATMKAITLQPSEQEVFARTAIAYRFGSEEKSPVTAQRLLRSQRSEDVGMDVWRTFNKVQEGLVRGGLRGRVMNAETGISRRSSVREIKGIDGQVKLNQALWSMAEEMAKIKQAA